MAAAGRHKTVEAVKFALYVQSQGGATGRYYVQRTLEHLKQCHDYFREDVKELRANLPGSANHAFRSVYYWPNINNSWRERQFLLNLCIANLKQIMTECLKLMKENIT